MTRSHGRRARSSAVAAALALLAGGAAITLDTTPAAAQAAPAAPAQELPAVAKEATVPPAAAPAPPPPPYSIPWQLRPMPAVTVVRSDTSTAFFEDAAGNSGTTVSSMLLASYKLTQSLVPIVRVGFTGNDAPGTLADGKSFLNPILGMQYAHKAGSYRMAAFGAVTLPIGSGAGDMPNAGAAGANAAGIRARSAMDNAMFATNYTTGIAGFDFGYVDHKLTVQAEVTLLQLIRTRGENAGAATDSARTNSTAGLHVGYFLFPFVSLGGEVRYQRWLTTPTQRNMMGVKVDIPSEAKDTATFAIGPRFHFKVGSAWVRPGISYSRAIDQPLRRSSYNMVQFDIPVIF